MNPCEISLFMLLSLAAPSFSSVTFAHTYTCFVRSVCDMRYFLFMFIYYIRAERLYIATKLCVCIHTCIMDMYGGYACTTLGSGWRDERDDSDYRLR
jgi:hypothetical protein